MATDSQNKSVPGVGLPPDIVEDILSAPRRQTLLRCLADADECVVMDDLVTRVIEREGSPTDADTRQKVRTNIYEEHLPKLTATDIVSYDSMREGVELRAPAIVDHLPE